MMSIDNEKYSYYQGYHDIGLFFLLLYFKSPNLGINTFQRISEFYIKDYLNKDYENSFNFEATLSLLLKVIKEIDAQVYDILEEICDKPHFALSWIITWFTHNTNSITLQYRIFDYLICSHPIASYVLSGTVSFINHLKSDYCRRDK